jgi:hypothetical protein
MHEIKKIRPISTVIDLNANSDFFHCNFNHFNTYSRIIFLIRQHCKYIYKLIIPRASRRRWLLAVYQKKAKNA